MIDLLNWIDRPSRDRGLRFLDDSSTWNLSSFETLAHLAIDISALLRDADVQQNDVVCIVLPTGPELVGTIFSTWVSGGTICPLVPPMMFEDEAQYVQHLARILGAAKPRVVVTDKTFRAIVDSAAKTAGLSNTALLDVADSIGGGVSIRKEAGQVALLQFTSGSSGNPRGVRVTFDNLASNIGAIRQWIRMGASDVTATWLPLYHDMGLIGCLLTPIVSGNDTWIMRPDQFIREPVKWLECFGRNGGTLTAAPNFGYGYAARKVKPESLAGMDFSKFRVAIAGAEPVDAEALHRFSELLAPFGFSGQAYLPAYGLAEATLAVTGRAPDSPVARALKLDWDSLSFGKPVSWSAESSLDEIDSKASSGWLVSSGRPHAGMHVRILDGSGAELPSDTLGEIFVSGPAVADGYTEPRPEAATRFDDSGIYCGDAGFIHDGELFVVGRIADSLKVRGRTVYAEDLEARVALATGLHRGRFVVVALPGHGAGSILGIAEAAGVDWATQAAQLIKGIVGGEIQVRVGIGPRGTIQRTSSGKPKRRLMWEMNASGTLPLDHSVDL